MAEAGWRPIPGAVASNASVLVERFDDGLGDVFYLTAQNSGAAARTVQLTLQSEALGITGPPVQVKELLRGRTLPVSRADADHRFADTLAPGETFVYEIRASRAGPPERGPSRRVEPRS